MGELREPLAKQSLATRREGYADSLPGAIGPKY